MPDYHYNSGEFDFSKQIKSDVASGKLKLSIQDKEITEISSKIMSGLREKAKGSLLTFEQILNLFKTSARAHIATKECSKIKMGWAKVNNFIEMTNRVSAHYKEHSSEMKEQIKSMDDISESQLAKAEKELIELVILNQAIEDIDELYLEEYHYPASSDYLREKL